ncbi:MAG: cytochrome C [Betaproteobacteria bacterium HGW-Betaproteobacteria-9]|jgi:mono/diheme cytochrome c family protein|nr:c-type cytochrome [Hydrogenophaga sp.]PKO27948.1 MAG: cytochrome C [Betaproteobacteria bacterium HGW-Betaproteobacteria-9]
MAAAFVGWRFVDPFGSNPTGVLRPDDAALVQRGAQIYQAQCASCHGANLEGQANWRERGADGRLPAPPHDETGHTWHHPDEVLIRLTQEGVAKAAGLPDYASNMPAFGDSLSDADTVAVLSWIKSRWPSDIQAHHNEINRQANQASLR